MEASDGSEIRPKSELNRQLNRRGLSFHFMVGSLGGLVILLLVLTGGSASLLQHASAGAMYDAQAHSLLHGNWDVPPAASGIESFGFGGKTYIYFGPFPAVLRIPIALITDRFDGRLGQLSILFAVVVTILATSVILEEVSRRALVGGPVGRFGRGLAAAFGLVMAGGSIITFISFRGDIYNEAIAWGLATALASISLMIRALRTSSTRCIGAASVCATLALQSRITLGVSAFAVIGVVLVISHNSRTRELFGISANFNSRRCRGWLIAATAAPLVAFVGVQEAKFGTLIVRPSDHLVNHSQPQFQTYLQRNGDTYFSASFVPANLLNMTVWPSAITLESKFPWLRPDDLDYGPSPGGPLFLGRSWSGSLAFTQTLLFGLGGAGVYRLWGRRSRARIGRLGGSERTATGPDEMNDVRMVGLAAILGFVATLAYGYQYHRFLADTFPALIVMAAVGVVWISRIGRTRMKIWIAIAVSIAAGWSIWVNTATAVLAQTERAWDPSPAALTRLYELQHMFGSQPAVVHSTLGDPLPPAKAIGTLLEIGDCDALLASAGTEGQGALWWPVERASPLKRTLDVEPSLLPTGITSLAAERPEAGGGEVFVSAALGEPPQLVIRGGGQETRYVMRGRVSRIVLAVDPVWNTLTIRVNESERSVTWTDPLPAAIGSASLPGITDFGGDRMHLCHDIAGGER